MLHRHTPIAPPFIRHRSVVHRPPAIRTLNPKALTESDFRVLSGKWADWSLGHVLIYASRKLYPDQTAGYFIIGPIQIYPRREASFGSVSLVQMPYHCSSQDGTSLKIVECLGLYC